MPDEMNLEKTKMSAKAYYSGLKYVFCPYLQENVYFKNDGFEHILSRSWNRGRSITEQYIRLRLLPKAVEVIRKSHFLQEHDVIALSTRQNANSRWEKRLKRVMYFVFIAVYPRSKLRVKVVVKQIEGGHPFFWSVHSSWRIEKDENGNHRRRLYSGDLERD